ncbi:DsbA family protein [Virgibacillus byunsanensis]|uniref:DsbA family protein n=1 Tax=Virgibacillus byunsanensis TaxID=570945 RepID=A0ABW3LS83_9BACI
MKGNNAPIKIAVIITLIIIGLIVALVLISNNNSGSSDGETFDDQPSIEGQPTLGDSDAPVQVVEFGDFKCPSCKAWSDNFYPQLVNDFVDTGKVTFSYINVLFHGEESTLASLAAESVYKQNPDAYWNFQKALYAEQPSDHNGEWVTTEKILEVANSVSGIDTESLKIALENESEMDEVNKDSQLVTDFGVELTPTIMVNETMIEDPFDYDAIKNAIEEALEGN